MTRYTIDPAHFTDEQWYELWDTGTIMPRTYDERENAKPFRRGKKYIRLTVGILREEAEFCSYRKSVRTEVLTAVADHLQALIGPDRLTRKDATSRLWDLLHSDIYTDAPEYANRVEEIFALAEIVLAKGKGRKAKGN